MSQGVDLHWAIRLILALTVIGALLPFAEALRRRWGAKAIFTRKAIHVAVGLLMLSTPAIFQDKYPVLLIPVMLFLVDLLVLRFSERFARGYATLGILYYPVVLFVLVFLCWDGQIHVLMGAVCVMSLGDGFSGFIGTALGRHKFTVTGDTKSLEGSIAMCLVSAISLLIVLTIYTKEPTTSLWAALLVPIVATVVEAASSKGLDNVTVPIAGAVLIYYLFSRTDSPALWLALSIPAAGVFALLALGLRALSPTGAVAAFVLGTLVFAVGRLNGAVALVTFFTTSSLLSMMQTASKKEAKTLSLKSSRRDLVQALANGGVPLFLLMASMFNPCWWSYMFFLAALASATADTWATEIGTLSGTKPYSLRGLVRVPPGSSGAVSLVGTLAAVLGSCLIALFAGFYGQGGGFNRFAFTAVAISGFVGCAIDSLLGATVQAQYVSPEGDLCEVGRDDAMPERGVPWIRNDMVNLIAGAFAAITCWLIFLTLGPHFCQ